MAALSVLRSGLWRLCQHRLTGSILSKHVLPKNSTKYERVRFMSGGHHKRTLEMLPSNFEWRTFKDHLHFYVMLGVLPIAALVTYSNVFIGRAELADIPEGYEPKHWEYYKHPITRFIARYLLDSPEKIYERHLHFVSEEKQKIQMKKLEEKVDLLVSEQGRFDSKRWYYIPGGEQHVAVGRDVQQVQEANEGFK